MKINNENLYNVSVKMPVNLSFLSVLKDNIWWCWQHDAVKLISNLDISLWEKCNSNLIKFLKLISQEKLDAANEDSSFIEKLKSIEEKYNKEVASKHLHSAEDIAKRKLAYFSLEYGIHESLRLYSGGLGVLSGDHLKAASDLETPMVAVGLLYRQGYFVQQLNSDGWQMEQYPSNELHDMPVSKAIGPDGNEVKVKLQLLDREVTIAVWVLNVGNIPLILLDSNLPENPDDLRDITARLYGGNKRMRLHQELILAVAGYKAIRLLGYPAESCHLNEGHAAFLSFARISDLVNRGVGINEAIEIVWSSNIFTTHTPVPAGNEVFDINLLKPYLDALQSEFKISTDTMVSWGLAPNRHGHELSMTILGLRMSYFANGVSKLHGEVAKQMWAHLWDQLPEKELTLTSITNGIHVDSWLSNENKQLLGDYLDKEDYHLDQKAQLKTYIENIANEKLWEARNQGRQKLVDHAHARLDKQLLLQNTSYSELKKTQGILKPDVLTVGFARRFATYKRATLLLQDPERLLRLLRDEKRPIQIIFAGKAHPADEGGKHLIQNIINFAKHHQVSDRLVFIEDYDIELGRYLTQGVDVWLNNPLRPQEASGTSGMKAAINGVLNCSILDGWWEEGYQMDHNAGWAIKNENTALSQEAIDRYEAESLYDLMETEIRTKFYDRNEDNIPTDWVNMMKASINISLHEFSSSRMVTDYDNRFYMPAINNYETLMQNNQEKAKELVELRSKYAEQIDGLYISQPKTDKVGEVFRDDKFEASCEVYLGELKPEQVKIEIYYGRTDEHSKIVDGSHHEMTLVNRLDNGNYLYSTEVICKTSGTFGITSRVTAIGDKWTHRIPQFMKWAH